MSDLDGLLRMMPIDQIAKKLGVDEAVAQDAVEKALPTIVAGLSANSKDKAGAASLEKALKKHEGRTPATVDEIDTDDGEKIVRNVFGPNKDKVVSAVASTSSKADESIIAKILPIVAPIVLSWLASRFLNKKTTDAAGSGQGGIGDLLGGLLGGAAGGKGGGDVLGGLLGGLLGGGKK